ncbi:hypothetical protein [Mesorhizobium australafricanum]|uniref:GcrA cell cycle regulator n=1 Tax=Mesorhizobium australafricanum TaxID=3072311 RepID=A0ABU4WQR2_9HYPH|nr:hypothetical protein [Mesorhizobium sp. VK3E]MDX8438375.1 hypothetical protein [Mesorhizobium sp. VK3E]
MHGTFEPRPVRIVRADNTWTFNESELLREHWPDTAKLRKLLPHRTERALQHMAKRCGLIPPKEQNIWTGAQDKTLTRMAAAGATREEIATELGLTVIQVANRLNYRGINLTKRPPKSYGDPLVDEIRRRAFDLKMSVTDLDRSLGTRRIFTNAWKGRRIKATHIHRAVKALGGELKIEWADQ